MIYLNLSPEWFFGYDIALEILFAIVSLFVAILAFRIYGSTGERSVKYFGASFVLFSISYFMQSFLNFFIISELNEPVSRIVKLQSIYAFNTMAFLIHVLFMTFGLVLLMYTVLRTPGQKVLWLMALVSFVAILFSFHIALMFFILSTIYLVFISGHFIANYLRNRQAKTLLVAVAFLFLLFGSFHFLIAVNHQLFYALGHVLELFAYLLILANLYLVLRK